MDYFSQLHKLLSWAGIPACFLFKLTTQKKNCSYLHKFSFLWRFPALCRGAWRVISDLGTSLQSLLGEQMFGSILAMCFECTKIE